MIHLVATGLAWAFLAGGAFFLVVGAVGLLRFPDFFTRMHGAGITDTLGVGLTLVGFCFLAGWSMATIKLLIILAFLWFTNPVATHALAKAALRDGQVPITAEDEEQEEDGPSAS
ncbi:MAG TPA: monovalent cation/H(+) antiporter subunit G [Gammaproteobacteria bacterium]|nr:monovalent cation/H(+) antiporter subunit G [Gammaproteobacteria bacterium]